MSVSYLIRVQSPGGGFAAQPVVKVLSQLSVSIFRRRLQLLLMPSAGEVSSSFLFVVGGCSIFCNIICEGNSSVIDGEEQMCIKRVLKCYVKM